MSKKIKKEKLKNRNNIARLQNEIENMKIQFKNHALNEIQITITSLSKEMHKKIMNTIEAFIDDSHPDHGKLKDDFKINKDLFSILESSDIIWKIRKRSDVCLNHNNYNISNSFKKIKEKGIHNIYLMHYMSTGWGLFVYNNDRNFIAESKDAFTDYSLIYYIVYRSILQKEYEENIKPIDKLKEQAKKERGLEKELSYFYNLNNKK